jgi:hypothetical protein
MLEFINSIPRVVHVPFGFVLTVVVLIQWLVVLMYLAQPSWVKERHPVSLTWKFWAIQITFYLYWAWILGGFNVR